MWIGGGSILLGVFFAPVGILAGAAALVFGIMALRITAPYDFKARGAVLGLVLGSVGLTFSLLVTGMTVYLYKEISDYTKCQNTANTISDSNQCKTSFARALEKKMHLRRGSINPGNIPS